MSLDLTVSIQVLIAPEYVPLADQLREMLSTMGFASVLAADAKSAVNEVHRLVL